MRSSIPVSLPNLLNEAIGSEPEESTNINGVTLAESLKQASNLKVGGSTYYCPIFSMTKFCIALDTASGRMTFKKMIFSKEFSLVFQSPGNFSSWASRESKIGLNFSFSFAK